MKRMGNAVRIDMTADGKLMVWVLDSYYVHGASFYSDKFASLRQVRRFLVKHGWVPEHFIVGPQPWNVAAKKFRLKYPKRGESATTYFHANVVTTAVVSAHSSVISIESAESADPTMRKAS